MEEARQGELLGPAATSGRAGPLEDLHFESRTRQHEGRRQPVRARSDDDGVRRAHAGPVSQLQDERLCGHDDLRRRAEAPRQLVEGIIGAVGLVVEEHDAS